MARSLATHTHNFTKLLVTSISLLFAIPTAYADPLNDCVDGWLNYWENLFGKPFTAGDACLSTYHYLASSPQRTDNSCAISS